jgi:hypothetical protein
MHPSDLAAIKTWIAAFSFRFDRSNARVRCGRLLFPTATVGECLKCKRRITA